MKTKQIVSIAGCIGMLLSSQAKAVVFDFQENGLGVLGPSRTFTEGGLTITASGFLTSGGPTDLYAKLTSGDASETGLGTAIDTQDHEILTTDFIQLDFSKVVPTTSAVLEITSVQAGEGASVYATKTSGKIDGSAILIGSLGSPTSDDNGPVDVTFWVNQGYYIDVTASSGNVLISTLSLQGSCPCPIKDIQYNFNGTQIIFQNTPGGSYVWFIGDGKVSGLPANTKTVLHIYAQSITIPATGSSPQFVVPVPDSFITFDPAVNTASTTFDTVNNVWRMTFPVSSMAGNIFYGGVAFKVPAAGLPGGIKNVDWSGKFGSVTPGLTVAWQWHAANYSNFTADYNSIAPKPTDDNHVSIYQNSDHAGTPEGTDSVSGKPWKSFVVGGASGGGGANYTGSGSSTIQFPPCDCP